jgi:hypothetical protein
MTKLETVTGNRNQRREFFQLVTAPLLERNPVMGFATKYAIQAVDIIQLILTAFLLSG